VNFWEQERIEKKKKKILDGKYKTPTDPIEIPLSSSSPIYHIGTCIFMYMYNMKTGKNVFCQLSSAAPAVHV
jgi:hypothetical protein